MVYFRETGYVRLESIVKKNFGETLAIVLWRTPGKPLRTRETVAVDTLARLATCRMSIAWVL